MTAIIDRIQRIVRELNNNDQYQEIISNFSDNDLFAFKIFLENSKNLESFNDSRDDIDDELNYWLEPLGVYLIVPEELRKKESKENMKRRKKEYESTLGTYRKVKADPLLREFMDVKRKLLIKLMAKQRMLNDQKNKRAMDLSEIKRYLKPIINNLRKKSWNKTQQTDFIYDLFCCFNFENCKNIEEKSYKKKLWMMIHRL